jgi:hypothetical protein
MTLGVESEKIDLSKMPLSKMMLGKMTLEAIKPKVMTTVTMPIGNETKHNGSE